MAGDGVGRWVVVVVGGPLLRRRCVAGVQLVGGSWRAAGGWLVGSGRWRWQGWDGAKGVGDVGRWRTLVDNGARMWAAAGGGGC